MYVEVNAYISSVRPSGCVQGREVVARERCSLHDVLLCLTAIQRAMEEGTELSY